ncbi:MAG: hypothetical protein JNM08_06065, partial [Rubrivivax sp.]|nr:hypothetical protein [Rubrivivax sp.]
GQPIWLIEAWRHRARGGEARLPATLHEAVLARTRALGSRVRQVLECACLGADDATPELLAAVTGFDALGVARALDHAVAAELLVADDQGHHRFGHDLVAQVLADSLSAARRRAVHGQWADTLAARGDEPGRVARHLEQAGRAADAVPWLLRAAQVAARRHAWPDVVAACAAVRRASADPRARLDAATLGAKAWRRQSDTPHAEAELESAMADAVSLGAGAVIDLTLERAELLADTGRADEALAALAAVESDPSLDAAQRLRLLRERANALGYAGRHAEAQPLLAQVIDALPASAVLERHRLLSIAARNAYWAGALPEARRLTELRLPLSRSLGDDSAVAAGLFRLGVLLREEGHVDRAEALLLESAALARQSGHVEVLRATLATLVTVRMGQMRLAEADALIDEAQAAAPFWESVAVEDVFDERRFMLHVLRGEVDAAWGLCDRQLRRLGGVQHLHFELSVHAQALWLGLACGDLERARRHWRAAQPLVQAAGESSLAAREVSAAGVRLLQAQGDAAGAVQAARAWLDSPAPRRVDEHHAVLCAGAQAAVDSGDLALAAQWLAEAEPLAVIPRTRAGWLLARLAHARAGGQPLAPAEQAVRDWLADGSLPALPVLEAASLRAALSS